VTIKAILIGIAVLILFGAGFYLGGLREKSKYEGLEATNAESLAKAYQAQIADTAAKVAAYEKEIDTLKTTTLTQFPTVPVRLCPNPRLPPSPKAGPVVSASTGVGTTDVKPVSSGPGPDYGSVLFGLADAFDQVVAKCREL
jgi:hypothetical protein